MIPVKIRRANARLVAPNDWDPSMGECADLLIRKEEQQGLPVMLSAWKPTALEIEMLQQGASIVLGIVGRGKHPPVMMYVSEED